MIARRNTQVIEVSSDFQLAQLTERLPLKRAASGNPHTAREPLGVFIPIRYNHSNAIRY